MSLSEKFLLLRFKRVRWVPVLLSHDEQGHVIILLKYRKSIHCQIIKKYSTAGGASNPNANTATRLRKHLATSTQVLICRIDSLTLLNMYISTLKSI